MLGPQLIALASLLVVSAMFSGTETALMSVNQIKVKALLKSGRRGAEALHRIKQNPHRLIITILIANNLANIGAASLATVIFTDIFGSSGVGIATGIMTFLVLVFGEITPKTLAAQNAERISLVVARPLELLSISLYPLVKMFEVISRLVTRVLGSGDSEERLSGEELRTIVTMGREQGILTKEAARMLGNVLKFEGTRVIDVMTPEVDMHMLDGDSTLKSSLEFIVRSPYSRFPVYMGRTDNIVGILDVDEVLRRIKSGKTGVKVKSMAAKPMFVPETKEIDDLLTEFEKAKSHMAIVVDEYGKLRGLVTIVDILEEIVGEVFDKSDRTSVYIKRIGPRQVRVDAKITIDEINEVLHLGIRDEHFNTLAGYIQHKMGRIPAKGEKIRLKSATITIDRVTDRKIQSVRITR